MKLALISDLHSNRPALEAVFADIDAQGVTEIACLGDIVGYGPEPEWCIDQVMERCAWSLMGNHDEALFAGAAEFNTYAREALRFTRKRLRPRWYKGSRAKERWEWLRGLPTTWREGRFLFVHGSPRNPVREYVLSTDGILNPTKLRAVFGAFSGVCLAGHTHQGGVFTSDLRFQGLGGADEMTFELPEGEQFFLNVGSVGQPRDRDPRACYAILEEGAITWRRVEYDVRTTQERILQIPELPQVLAQRLSLGR
ncbi:MAG: metallophosphoesterase family protein [Planctomycetota bacterium]|nr:metallophosphoesterase family protein [Planctomycetota bacterium]